MTEHVYNKDNMHLKGIMTKVMIEKLGIPMEKTKVHGILKLPFDTYNLYKVPAPYNEIDVFYGELNFWNNVAPHYYFNEHAIERYRLTPIGENELPAIVCKWNFSKIGQTDLKKIGTIQYVYNRKNEEKYRIKFLTDPNFNPRIWEFDKLSNKTTN